MKAQFRVIRHHPLLRLLAMVPAVFINSYVCPGAHTLLFVLFVLAIVPLAALLSLATESVAAKTGDAVGGLRNATPGNLTELVIAFATLRARQDMLVKASIAGAIVTPGSPLLAGCRRHDSHRLHNNGPRDFQRALHMVHRCSHHHGLPRFRFRYHALPPAARRALIHPRATS